MCYVKILLFAIIILLIFSILLIILIKNKKQAIKIYSLQTFLGSSSHSFEEEPNEQKKSFIDTLNDFFKDDNDGQLDDDHGDTGGDDAGE